MANHSDMSAPPLRECDIVLKGGIASGVIYPRLITTLAKVYKLRSFGGTSAGAIAAAAGAAAQVGKLTGGNSAAFDSLEQLPNLLATISPGDSGSVLFHLFQPQPKLARLFALLAAGLNAPSAGRRVSSIAVAAIRNFPLGAIVGAAPGVVTLIYLWHIGAVLAAAFAVIGALVGAVVAALLSLGRHLPGNYFGLCNGMPGVPRSHSSHAALTPWLHQYLNELAGKRAEDPLTFGELWSGRLRINSTPWDAPSPHAPRAVDLAMITTALNLGRPLRLPLESEDFYFVREEIDKLFPPAVVAWLVEYARPSKTAQSLRIDGSTYYALPAAADFPLIVAVRMSLSFPLLLSAVPLYVSIARCKPMPGRRRWQRACISPMAGSAVTFRSSSSTVRCQRARPSASICATFTRITPSSVCGCRAAWRTGKAFRPTARRWRRRRHSARSQASWAHWSRPCRPGRTRCSW